MSRHDGGWRARPCGHSERLQVPPPPRGSSWRESREEARPTRAPGARQPIRTHLLRGGGRGPTSDVPRRRWAGSSRPAQPSWRGRWGRRALKLWAGKLPGLRWTPWEVTRLRRKWRARFPGPKLERRDHPAGGRIKRSPETPGAAGGPAVGQTRAQKLTVTVSSERCIYSQSGVQGGTCECQVRCPCISNQLSTKLSATRHCFN